MKKQQAADKTAANTMYGLQAVSQGSGRCGPGAKATSFGAARAADDLAYINLAEGGGRGGAAGGAAGGGAGGADNGMAAGGGLSGRSSPTMSSSSGRSSPAVERVAVPPLGDDLAELFAVLDIQSHTAADAEQVDFFVNEGFTYDQINRELAVEMLFYVLDTYHYGDVMEFETVEQMKAGWERDPLDDDGALSECEVPGIGAEVYSKILFQYRVPAGGGGQPREWFAHGWPEAKDPTTAKFEHEARMLAEDCLPGRAVAATAKAGARASSDGGARAAATAGGNPEATRTRPPRMDWTGETSSIRVESLSDEAIASLWGGVVFKLNDKLDS